MRAPRRTFAAPLVLTVAACSSGPSPKEPIHDNPPGPQRAPADAAPVDPNNDPNIVANPPPPMEPERRWQVMKIGTKCQATEAYDCPAGASCNPPPPTDVQCPPGITDTTPVTIVKHPGQAVCMIPPAAPHCPPNVACNPPPPKQVPCPN